MSEAWMRMGRDSPKLFSDWREFFREFIIIVLGVLTALLAQSVAIPFAAECSGNSPP